MKSLFHLLQINLSLQDYRFALLGFLTAFIVTLISMPPVISLLKKYSLFDMPGERKIHSLPVPTLGGIAIVAGMTIALSFWYSFRNTPEQICFFFSLIILTALGIMDDLKNLAARYKFMIQLALATLMAVSGLRVTNFEGLFGLYHLPLFIQYSFTILAIVGITNAFNLIDGIDGLAGSLGFMSLVTLGIFLGLNHDQNSSLIAFALAGGILAFLFFNYNPAKIFMGDTGSLVLGFTISVLCICLMQSNILAAKPALTHAPIFALGIVLIPVFDTIRVFALRIWKGQSPFTADKTHIHHLLRNAGFNQAYTTGTICFFHGFILLEAFQMQEMKQEVTLLFMLAFMLAVTLIFKNLTAIHWKEKRLFVSISKLFSHLYSDKE